MNFQTQTASQSDIFPIFAFNTLWYRLGDRQFNQIVLKAFERFGDLPDGATIIEPGCGDFRLGRLQLQRGWRIDGYDKSKSAVALAEAAIEDLGLTDEVTHADFTVVPAEHLLRDNPRGAFSWRVLHTIPADVRLDICRKLREVLPSGASFFATFLSCEPGHWSWEREAAGDDFVPGIPNDLREVMRLDELRVSIPPTQRKWLPEHWLFTFFTRDDIRALAAEAGFEIADEIVPIKEASAWPHLLNDHPMQTWLFTEFRVP